MRREQLEQDLAGIHDAGFGWALACCERRPDEAEEVLQIAYLKAVDGRARFDGRSSLRTWFFGVVKRTAAEQRRRRLVREVAMGRWLAKVAAPAPLPTPEHLSRDAEVQARLQQMLQLLSRRQRDLLHLVFYQEMTIEEAAAVLGITVGTARTHYERGKARLRKLLQGAGEKQWNRETATTV